MIHITMVNYFPQITKGIQWVKKKKKKDFSKNGAGTTGYVYGKKNEH